MEVNNGWMQDGCLLRDDSAVDDRMDPSSEDVLRGYGAFVQHGPCQRVSVSEISRKT